MVAWNSGSEEVWEDMADAKRRARKREQVLQARVTELEAKVEQYAQEMAEIKALLGLRVAA